MVQMAEDELKLSFCMCEAWLSKIKPQYYACTLKSLFHKCLQVATIQNLTVYRQCLEGSHGCQPEIFELQTEV